MLNFKELDKKALPITFADGITINVLPPTKAGFEKLQSITQGKTAGEQYKIISELLSRNVENKTITADYLAETLDVSDFGLIVREYRSYVMEVISSPN